MKRLLIACIQEVPDNWDAARLQRFLEQTILFSKVERESLSITTLSDFPAPGTQTTRGGV